MNGILTPFGSVVLLLFPVFVFIVLSLVFSTQLTLVQVLWSSYPVVSVYSPMFFRYFLLVVFMTKHHSVFLCLSLGTCSFQCIHSNVEQNPKQQQQKDCKPSKRQNYSRVHYSAQNLRFSGEPAVTPSNASKAAVNQTSGMVVWQKPVMFPTACRRSSCPWGAAVTQMNPNPHAGRRAQISNTHVPQTYTSGDALEKQDRGCLTPAFISVNSVLNSTQSLCSSGVLFLSSALSMHIYLTAKDTRSTR